MYTSTTTTSNGQLDDRSSHGGGSSLKAFLGDLPAPIKSLSDSFTSFALSSSSSSSSSSRGGGSFEGQEEEDEYETWDKYEDARHHYFDNIIKNWDEQFALRKDDVQFILGDDGFHELQESLRRRGCITNTFLQQRVHQYIYKQRIKKKKQRQRTSKDSSSST